MKTKNLAMLLAMSASLTSFQALANEDSILNSDPININGYVVEERPATDHELEQIKNELRTQKNMITINKEKSKNLKELVKTTEKLSDATEDMIETRRESNTEIENYKKKVDCLMQDKPSKECEKFVRNRRNNVEDEVKVQAAAPALAIEVQAPKKETKTDHAIKVLPYVGMVNYTTERESLESGLDLGLRVEADVTSRLSVGAGIGYTTLKTRDFASSYNGFGGGYGYGGYGYANPYGNIGAREIQYNNVNLNLYSKFFLVNSERFRPYIGLGARYNRSALKYDNNSMYGNNYGSYSFGNEELNSSYMSGEVMLGTEILFSGNMGVNVELNYSRGLSGNLSSDQKYNNIYTAPDQWRLNELRDEMAKANVIGINASFLIKF